MSRDIVQEKKKVPDLQIATEIDFLRKNHVTRTKKEAYISNKLQLQNLSSPFIHKNKSLLSTTSTLLPSPMAQNTTASLDKLTCTDYMDFSKSQDRFEQFFWSKIDSNYLNVNLKVFKKGGNKGSLLVQAFTMG